MTPFLRQPDRGAALLTTLVLVTATALVTVSYYAVMRKEAGISGAEAAAVRARLGERAALEHAVHLLAAATAADGYLVSAVSLRESGTAAGPTRYAFASLAGPSGIDHIPLFAGGLAGATPLPDFDAIPAAALADAAAAAPELTFDDSPPTRAIETHGLTLLREDGTVEAENRRPRTGFIEIEPEPGAPYRTRYTFWIEDLEGYPDLEAAGARSGRFTDASGAPVRDGTRFGYSGHDSRTGDAEARFPLEGGDDVHYLFPARWRGQQLHDQIAPGLSPREISLLPWSTPSLPAAAHPFRSAALARAATRPGPGDAGAAGAPGENRFVLGLLPYRNRPLVPYGHGYADEGLPRHNINGLVAARDMDLARIIERNLPAFEERKGGFPESYVATLAANAIDYADEDNLPSLPSNTVNAGDYVFRGVDGYTPVNELFVRFEYTGYEDHPEEWRAVFTATVWAEFWNPFNRAAEMEEARLRLRFLEPFGFLANAAVHRIEEEHLDRDEPFATPVSLSVPPNGYLVHRFGEMRWKVPLPKDEDSPIAFPVVQDIRADLPGRSDTRAHYELWLGGALVDSSGRAGESASADYGFFFPRHQPVMAPGTHFMRLSPGNSAVLASGILDNKGSHLGDPWMSFYSRATVESAQYRFKASPGARNFDRDKVSAARPDWFKDQVRVRAWPDGGYDPPAMPGPGNDDQLPDDPAFAFPGNPAFAPWRLSQLGVFHSVTELGHLHDPVMWACGPAEGPGSVVRAQSAQRYDALRGTWLRSLPPEAAPSPFWGGGNTLRIGRPEHALFDRPGMRASQLLDLFHAGFAGTNLGAAGGGDAADLYRHHDPRDHQPPPAGRNAAESSAPPRSLLYDEDLHAGGAFELVHGHLNLNAAPSAFEIEALLRGPSVSSDLRLVREDPRSPLYEREGESGVLRSALDPGAVPAVAAGLLRARPYYSPSHLARVLSELLERHDALPEHGSDAEAEEVFARIFNTTTFSSRHFRVFTYAETCHPATGEVFARSRRVHELFLRPERDAAGAVVRSHPELLSSRRL